MSSIESEDAHGSRPPGSDVADDGDLPDDPLLGGGTADDPTESDFGGVGLSEPDEAA